MPLPSTRRLRREIDAQSQQLAHDIARVKSTTAQMRHTAIARITSPLGLLSAASAGFITGKIAGRASPSKHLTQQTIGNIAALTLSAARSISMQVFLPMAVEWVQTRFAKYNNAAETANKENADSNTAPADHQ
jgi:hypothetical protein